MDEKKTIRKYIGSLGSGGRIAGALLLLAALAAALLAVRAGAEELPAPAPFDALAGERNTYVYLDVIGVSDWVYSYDDLKYYILEDAEHYIYVGTLSSAQLSSLERQRAYWDGETGEERPVRITGITLRMTDTMKDNFMEVLDISAGEFDEYFGYRCFSGGNTPTGERSAMWTALAVVFGCFGLGLLLAALPNASAAKKSLARLETTGQLERAAAELESPLAVQVQRDRARLTNRYIFGRHVGLAAAWEDVIWCYQRVTRVYFVVSARFLMVCTADGKAHAIPFGPKDEAEVLRVMETIAERNPGVLLGFSGENRKRWKERCKAER